MSMSCQEGPFGSELCFKKLGFEALSAPSLSDMALSVNALISKLSNVVLFRFLPLSKFSEINKNFINFSIIIEFFN